MSYRLFTEEEVKQLKRLHKAGHGPTEIARRLGRSKHAVRHKLIRSGLLVGRAPESPKRPQTKDRSAKRTCLKCRRPFLSEWEGNRVCGSCKAVGSYSSHLEAYAVVS